MFFVCACAYVYLLTDNFQLSIKMVDGVSGFLFVCLVNKVNKRDVHSVKG